MVVIVLVFSLLVNVFLLLLVCRHYQSLNRHEVTTSAERNETLNELVVEEEPCMVTLPYELNEDVEGVETSEEREWRYEQNFFAQTGRVSERELV